MAATMTTTATTRMINLKAAGGSGRGDTTRST
jgi:hypothetical protein